MELYINRICTCNELFKETIFLQYRLGAFKIFFFACQWNNLGKGKNKPKPQIQAQAPLHPFITVIGTKRPLFEHFYTECATKEKKIMLPFGRFLKVALTPQKHTTISYPKKYLKNHLKTTLTILEYVTPMSLLNVQNYLKTNLKNTSKLLEYVHPPAPPYCPKESPKKTTSKLLYLDWNTPPPFRKYPKVSSFILVWLPQVCWIHVYWPWLIVQTCK